MAVDISLILQGITAISSFGILGKIIQWESRITRLETLAGVENGSTKT